MSYYFIIIIPRYHTLKNFSIAKLKKENLKRKYQLRKLQGITQPN